MISLFFDYLPFTFLVAATANGTNNMMATSAIAKMKRNQWYLPLSKTHPVSRFMMDWPHNAMKSAMEKAVPDCERNVLPM